MNAAFVGFPLSGKSTLTAAATGIPIDPSAMPHARKAVVKVPDDRLNVLSDMYKPKKNTPATIEYIDVPGFSLADQKGLEDFKRYLPEIRKAELLVAVVRAFENPSVPAYRNRVDADADLGEFRDELVLADLETISNRVDKLIQSLKKPSKSHDLEKRELEVLEVCKDALEAEKPLFQTLTNDEQRRTVASFALLTLKPLLVVFNVSEDRAAETDPPVPEHAAGVVNVCAAIEEEIALLDADDGRAFLEDLGLKEPAGARLIRKCYESLGLVSFLTAGADEVRAWTIRKGSDAVEAASKIHSDIARGFIRAETVAFADMIENGDFKAAKSAGKVRQEGKTYVVQDGDIINFKFNV